MKKLLILVQVIILSICFACNKPDKLVGQWKRIGDIGEGMTVEVIKQNDNYIGKLIFVPDTMYKLFDFVKDDIKWKNFKNVAENKYEYGDLGKAKSFFGIETNYYDSQLTILSNDTLSTRLFAKGNEQVGTEQKWIRIK